MRLNDICKLAYKTAKSKGWWDEPTRTDLEILALIHTEVSETVEACRNSDSLIFYNEKGEPSGVLIELADIIIRVADWCGHEGWDIEEAIKIKMEWNKTRSYRHGGKLK